MGPILIYFAVFVLFDVSAFPKEVIDCTEKVCPRSDEWDPQCVILEGKLDLFVNPREVECAKKCGHAIEVLELNDCRDLVMKLSDNLNKWKDLSSGEIFEKMIEDTQISN